MVLDKISHVIRRLILVIAVLSGCASYQYESVDSSASQGVNNKKNRGQQDHSQYQSYEEQSPLDDDGDASLFQKNEIELSAIAPYNKATHIGSTATIENPAVAALIRQASEQRIEGRQDLAVSTLERALRISPHTPQIHLNLGRLKLEQGKANAAIQLAFKGQSLLHSDQSESLNPHFWQLLGDSYDYLGNTEKARQAYQKVGS